MKNSAELTPSEICRILHIIRKLKSIIALLLNIQNIFKLLKEEMSSFCSPKVTQLRPQVSLDNGSKISSGLHFWRHFDIIGSIICSRLQFWRHWFNTTKFFSNLANSIWLWWIMHVVLTGEIFWWNNI